MNSVHLKCKLGPLKGVKFFLKSNLINSDNFMSILEEIHRLGHQIQFHQAEGLHSILPEEIELKFVKNEEMQDKHLKRIY